MTRPQDIDTGDLLSAIIAIYADTGRCSQQDIATKLGVSKAGVRHRVHQLADAGLIINERDSIRPRMPKDYGFSEGRIELYYQIVPGEPATVMVL